MRKRASFSGLPFKVGDVKPSRLFVKPPGNSGEYTLTMYSPWEEGP